MCAGASKQQILDFFYFIFESNAPYFQFDLFYTNYFFLNMFFSLYALFFRHADTSDC